MTWFEAAKNGSCSQCGAPTRVGDRMWAVRRGYYTCEPCGFLREEAGNSADAGQMESSVIESLKAYPPEVMGTALAQGMIYLARQLDRDEVAARDVPNFTKEIRQSLAQLEMQYPAEPEDDNTDKALQRRERNMAGLIDESWEQ